MNILLHLPFDKCEVDGLRMSTNMGLNGQFTSHIERFNRDKTGAFKETQVILGVCFFR